MSVSDALMDMHVGRILAQVQISYLVPISNHEHEEMRLPIFGTDHPIVKTQDLRARALELEAGAVRVLD